MAEHGQVAWRKWTAVTPRSMSVKEQHKLRRSTKKADPRQDKLKPPGRIPWLQVPRPQVGSECCALYECAIPCDLHLRFAIQDTNRFRSQKVLLTMRQLIRCCDESVFVTGDLRSAIHKTIKLLQVLISVKCRLSYVLFRHPTPFCFFWVSLSWSFFGRSPPVVFEAHAPLLLHGTAFM